MSFREKEHTGENSEIKKENFLEQIESYHLRSSIMHKKDSHQGHYCEI